jgi:hypothetical protein
MVSLLTGLIDYAGLFPPAELDLNTALKEYQTYRAHQDSWMLGSFIIQAARLRELREQRAIFKKKAPFPLVVVGRGGDTMGEFHSNVDRDVLDARRLLEESDGGAVVTGYELRVPDELLDGRVSRKIEDVLADVINRIVQAISTHTKIYFEANWQDKWRRRLDSLLAGLDAANSSLSGLHPAGFKLRCGGETPERVPRAEIVAGALHGAVRAKLPLKLTAGLHHPVLKKHESFGGDMHGFLNVYFALISTLHHRSDERALRLILEERDPDAFKLDREGIHWRDLSLSSDQIEQARERIASGHGSCSFDEPREDLIAMKWLPRHSLR